MAGRGRTGYRDALHKVRAVARAWHPLGRRDGLRRERDSARTHAHLCRQGESYGDYLGVARWAKLGNRRRRKHAFDVGRFATAVLADDGVLSAGNAYDESSTARAHRDDRDPFQAGGGVG